MDVAQEVKSVGGVADGGGDHVVAQGVPLKGRFDAPRSRGHRRRAGDADARFAAFAIVADRQDGGDADGRVPRRLVRQLLVGDAGAIGESGSSPR
jgi:hypothetical protein